jgi:hypothetical protein
MYLGGLWFFVSFINFSSDNTRVRILFFLSRKARIFFPESNITLYDNNSESDYFYFLHQNQNIFFNKIGNQNIFLEKKHNPPPPFKLNGRSLMVIKVTVEIINLSKWWFQLSLRRWSQTQIVQPKHVVKHVRLVHQVLD